MTWQPISTAPRDGTRILVWDWLLNEATICQWSIAKPFGSSHGWVTDAEGPGYCSAVEASHWMPLPDGPEVSTESERIAVMDGK